MATVRTFVGIATNSAVRERAEVGTGDLKELLQESSQFDAATTLPVTYTMRVRR